MIIETVHDLCNKLVVVKVCVCRRAFAALSNSRMPVAGLEIAIRVRRFASHTFQFLNTSNRNASV